MGLGSTKPKHKVPPQVAFDEELLRVASNDLNASSGILKSDMENDTRGVISRRIKQVDKRLNKGEYTEEDIKKAFSSTRDFIRQKYGDKVILWRADAPQKEKLADARTVYMADKNVAKKFEDSNRIAKPYLVDVDDILGVYTSPSGYYETLVKKEALEKGDIRGKKRIASKAGLMSAALGAAGGASASEIAESFLPMALTPSTLAPGTLTPEQKAEADAAYQRKLQEEEAAKAKAQALLRSGAIKSETKMAKGGMMNRSIPGFQDGGNAVEPTTGNDVPIGSLPEEVADDIPAKLSTGEFVLPADVVRFIGLERLMKLRDEAKEGLRRMAEVGQMGNAEEVGEKAEENFEEEDTGKFESDIDEILSEVDSVEGQTEKAFAKGGVVGGPPWLTGFDMSKAPKNPVFDVRYYKHPDGRIMYVTFFNGKPMTPIPDGFTQTDSPVDQQVGVDDTKKTTTPTAPAAIDTTLGGGVGGEGESGTTGGPMSLEAAAQSIAIGNALSGYASGTKGLGPGAAVAGILGSLATNVGYSALSNYASRDVLSSMAEAQAEADAMEAGLNVADAVGMSGFGSTGNIGADGPSGGSTDSAGNMGLGGSEAGGAGDAGAGGGSDAGSGGDGGGYGGVMAKGGLVAKRKKPAKKTKGKGLASR